MAEQDQSVLEATLHPLLQWLAPLRRVEEKGHGSSLRGPQRAIEKLPLTSRVAKKSPPGQKAASVSVVVKPQGTDASARLPVLT